MSDASHTNKNLIALSVGALALLGASTLTYSVLSQRAQTQKLEALKAKRSKRSLDDEASSFLSKRGGKVRLYFDQNDEQVDEETVKNDTHNFKGKYHMIEVNLGSNDDFEMKENKITMNLFKGEKKTDNAQIFVKSLEKAKQNHMSKLIEKEFGEKKKQMVEESLEVSQINDSQVILDLNPNKFEKQKDSLFYDFLAMYTKRSIQEKNSSQKRSASLAM